METRHDDERNIESSPMKIARPSSDAKIQFVYDFWDLTESGDVVYSDYIIESHACSEEELGLTGDNSKFMPIQDTSKNFVNVYKKKFQCIDQDDLEIYGNFST